MKLKPLKNTSHTCINCMCDDRKLKMNERVYAGFGMAKIIKGKKDVYIEEPNLDYSKAPTLMKFELMARKNPRADWRYILDLPLRNAVYQRHGKNLWVLVEKGLGFA